ncbi:MAG TPA: YqaJ viral recombinase family protein [Methylophilaceae bacterium]|nr:YqaJ viral recombinase family protein [Methylophilaceae bacterium]
MSEQRSPEWFKERAGKFTGSRFVDVLARHKTTGKPLKCYHDLIWQLVVERMTGQPKDSVDGIALKWGRDVEPYAREAYEFETGLIVIESDFITHPQYDFVGASPDGLVGTDGGLEMKCPKDSGIHLERFESGMDEEEFMPQVMGCLWVTGRKWWDWVSYDPRMPEEFRLYRQRITRDDEYIAKLEKSVLEAEELVKEKLNKLQRKAA